MTKYAKLTEAGQLQILARIPYVSVRPARDAVRAAENVDDVEKALHM